jgi:hypothetical protein
MTSRLAEAVRRRPLHALVATAAATALVITATAVVAQGVAGGFRAEPAPIDRLMAALQQLHLTNCTPVFQQAGRFLFENAPVNFVVQPLGPDTNRWPTVVTSEGNHPPGTQSKTAQTRFTTLIVAPAGTCSGLYQQVIYWPETCAALKARVFGQFQGEHALLAKVRVSETGPGLQLYLMPAGVGCVSIKKELIG